MQNKVGSVTDIAELERVVSSLTLAGRSLERIAAHMGLRVKSVKKLLENVSRKINQAKSGQNEGSKY